MFGLSFADQEATRQARARLAFESQNVVQAANRRFLLSQQASTNLARSIQQRFGGGQPVGLISGLLSLGSRLLTGGARVAPRLAGAVARQAPRVGRLAIPLAGAVAGGAAFEAGLGLFGDGDGGGAPMGSAVQAALAAGGQASPVVGGRIMVTAPNGDFQLFRRDGTPIRPSLIIPAGQRLPGGATVVSTRNGGQLIGITVRRRRRGFAGEVRRVRNVLQGCKAIERAARPAKRRA